MTTPETSENQAQIQRIVASRALKASELQRNLLHYLADKSFSGESQNVKEYTVGLDVFGKPSSYDPRQESVVRMHVGRLRQKVAEYYRTEGIDDPIVVDLPKGGFSLTFLPKPAGVSVAPSRRTLGPRELALALMLVVAVATVGVLASRMSRAGRVDKSTAPVGLWTPALQDLWSPLLSADRPLMVTFAADKSSATGVTTANAAFLLGQFLGQRKRDVFPVSNDSLSVGQITMGDVIFVGPAAGNPHVQAIPPVNVAFTLTPEGVEYVNPSAGEPAFLADGTTTRRQNPDGESQGYALISCLPGLYGNGTILYFEGNQVGTVTGAVQAMTDPELASQLVARLKSADGVIPRYYQAVLRVKAMDEEPMDVAYVAHKTLAITKHDPVAQGRR